MDVIQPTLNPAHDPIRFVSTDRLIEELGRRSTVRALVFIEEIELVPGQRLLKPCFSWGCRSGMAHEALGLVRQLELALEVDAKSQLVFGGKSMDQFFADRAAASKPMQAPAVALAYDYIPPSGQVGKST